MKDLIRFNSTRQAAKVLMEKADLFVHLLEDVPKGGTTPSPTFPTIEGHVIRSVAKASHAREYSAVFNDESGGRAARPGPSTLAHRTTPRRRKAPP